MNKHVRTLAFALVLAVMAAASNLFADPAETQYRIFALVWIDVSRKVCAGEGESAKAKLESALQSSGVLELTTDSLCAGGICGDLTPKDMRLDDTLKSMRAQHIQMAERESPEKKRAECQKFTSMFDKMQAKGKPPAEIYERFMASMPP